MNILIREATADDVSTMTALLVACADTMAAQGMTHWLGVYDEAAVKQNMLDKSVYVLVAEGQLCGCIALGTAPADYYQACWPNAPTADYYITQLAVHPSVQDQGFGKQLMQYCLDKVSPSSVALDAVDHYPALLAFYQQFGFHIVRTGIGLGDKRHLMLRIA